MVEDTKLDMTYDPTPAENAHFQQFKQKIEGAKQNVERLREQLELIKSSDEADAEELEKNPTLSPLKRMGGKVNDNEANDNDDNKVNEESEANDDKKVKNIISSTSSFL